MACYVRLMRKEDVARVTEIDREAFPSQWPPPDYHRELENRLARYIIACDDQRRVNTSEVETSPEKGSAGLMSKLRWWLNRNLPSHEPSLSNQDYIIGFAGFWLMADEAHLISIAVWETYRRNGVGELLLISVINLAKELKAQVATLEARVSNTAAQNLYSKYGFIKTGIRRGYYLDNREDGILMSTEAITSTAFQKHFEQLKHEYARKCGITLEQIDR